MKKMMTVLLITLLLLSLGSMTVFANGKGTDRFVNQTDGRQANGLEKGSFDLNWNEQAVFETGDTLSISVGNLVIDGPIDTIKWSITDQYGTHFTAGDQILDTAGSFTLTVQAFTYFKNGQKAGLIHSSTVPQSISFDVVEPDDEVITGITNFDYTYRSHVFVPNDSNQGGNAQLFIGYFDITFDFNGESVELLNHKLERPNTNPSAGGAIPLTFEYEGYTYNFTVSRSTFH